MNDERSVTTHPVRHTSKHMTAFFAVLLSAPLSLATTGCAADVSSPDAELARSASASNDTKTDSALTSTAAAVTGTVATLGTTATGTVGAVGQTVGVCSPLSCCFPTGSEWGTDSFQTTLKSLGCSTPRAYAERYEESDWWMFSQCPVTPALLAAVAEYSNVSPIYSQVAVNECLYVNSLTSLQVNSVFVEFDPTCSSCRSVAK